MATPGSNLIHRSQAKAWLLALLLASCSGPATQTLQLSPIGFDQLPGWPADHVEDAMPAVLQSCDRLAGARPTGGQLPQLGTVADWAALCAAARQVPPGDEPASRHFLQQRLQPYAMTGTDALFTGYYEPEVEGARTPDAHFATPLLARPADLVDADLGAFLPDLAGKRISGRVQDGHLVPYWDRTQILAGAAGVQSRPILYLANPQDAFFLQIQGSGRVRLPDGSVERVGYAGQNGRPYVAIGKVLVDRGDLRLADVSMQSIRAWLDQHPAEAPGILAQNPSYVFFRSIPGLAAQDGPVGAQGVALTPGRSAAVDRSFVPLGVPLWIDTTTPADGAPLQRLMVAQDIGGAIKGATRADIFFGWGHDAEAVAGRMKQPGRMFVLLPRPAP
ncbi:murein transglycosylase A [Acidisphaera sp. L21]|uniref:murein transglycosylase A n=1 Tax=Acidisphaera sp. L21 TaxID=1641851 RepID=UPI00131B64D4|nr:MltA domain-containing protein [Acidisphaera sp. L21]